MLYPLSYEGGTCGFLVGNLLDPAATQVGQGNLSLRGAVVRPTMVEG